MSRFWAIAPVLTRDDIVATGDLSADGSTQVWSVPDGRELARFTTTAFESGPRLALCTPEDRLVVVAGARERYGATAYDALTGERLWQRTDLERIKWVGPAGVGGSLVAVRPDLAALHILDALTGDTVAKLRGSQRYSQSPYAPIGAGEAYGHVLFIDRASWSVRWRAPVAGFALLAVAFALLAVAFAPEALLVANTVDGGSGENTSVTCFDLDGHRLWQHANPPETNCPWLTWDEATGEWLGIRFHVGHRDPDTLIRWSPEGGLLSAIALHPRAHEYSFLARGRRLVTGLGSIRDTATGREVGQLRVG